MAIVLEGEKTVKTCVIWNLDMAVAIPKVDLVLTRHENGLVAAPRAEVVTLLARHSQWKPERQVGREALMIGLTADLFDQTPTKVQAKLHALMKPIEARRIATDHVLDEELVVEAFG
jgi:hypothetical protein